MLVWPLTCQTILSCNVSVKSSLFNLARSLGSLNVLGLFSSFLLSLQKWLYPNNTHLIIPHCTKDQFKFLVPLSLFEFCVFYSFSMSLNYSITTSFSICQNKMPLSLSNVAQMSLSQHQVFICFLRSCHTMWRFKVFQRKKKIFQRCLRNS